MSVFLASSIGIRFRRIFEKRLLPLILWLLAVCVPLFLFLKDSRSLLKSVILGDCDWSSVDYELRCGIISAGAELVILGCLFFILLKKGFLFSSPLKVLASILLCFCYIYFALPNIGNNKVDICLCGSYIIGCFFLIYAIFKRWSMVVWVVLYSLPLMVAGVSLRYQVKIDAGLMAEVLGASPQDASKFLTPANITLLLLGIFGVVLFFYLLHRCLEKEKRSTLAVAGFVVLVFSIWNSYSTHRALWGSLSKENISHRTPETVMMKLYQASRLANLKNEHILTLADTLPSPAAAGTSISADREPGQAVCILHIGESVRSDHLSLLGYHRKTTPMLDANRRVIAFGDCISVAPYTVSATMTILTDGKADIKEQESDRSLEPSCGGMMDLFHANGFTCYSFRSTENKSATWGALYEQLSDKVFSASADKVLFKGGKEDSMEQVKQMKTLCDKGGLNKRSFVFLNNQGSHIPFFEYNHESPAFEPTSPGAYSRRPDIDSAAAEQVINAYDNTIVYLDEYISKMLKELEGKPYIYVYISDHGEYLGDKGVWVRKGDKHTFFTTPVCQVPLLIIPSPEFENLNPHFHEALEQLRQHTSLTIGQEHVFHTLLGLFGIQTPYYDETLDLTSPRVQPYMGPHPSRNGQSADGKKWY